MSYTLYAQFPRSQTCRDRQYSGLLRWSAYEMALPIPPEKPDEDFVRQRILAERVPVTIDMYVTQTMPYAIATPDIQTNVRQHLNAYNDDTVEASMDAQVDAAISSIMPAYAKTQVSEQAVKDWYESNGFGAQSTTA